MEPLKLPEEYIERVYAGVLGKIIGVYLGRPFEGWTYEQIQAEFGQIDYYVHDKLGVPLVVSDDDISGTFTFLRALEDHGISPNITSEAIGKTWLNYIIENKTILWWGGIGQSTEHTAFLNLKHGIMAPTSGSIAVNGTTVAEQIGAQIFIDGWGLVAPGNPDLAVKLAGEAATVSHDGEAVYAAKIVAAMVSLAFVEQDINILLDAAIAFIPAESTICRMINDIREWYAVDFDWRVTRYKLEEIYGYQKFPGNCHVVPNHGLIILALLHGKGDLTRSLMIVNSCGWDTDCNSANVGCILGVRNGLGGFETGPDWRGPVADRMFLPTADGGRCITDAVQESYYVASLGYALASSELTAPKDGARFHFSLLGSTQGFVAEDSVECNGVVTRIYNGSEIDVNSRSLRADFRYLASGRVARVRTATFASPSDLKMPGYGLQICPTLYPGQTVIARVRVLSDSPVEVRLFLRQYNPLDTLTHVFAPAQTIEHNEWCNLTWRIPEEGGYPIAEIGIEVTCNNRADGFLEIDKIDWSDTPDVTLGRTEGGNVWQRGWVNNIDQFTPIGESSAFQLIQNNGNIGLIAQGTSEWENYTATANMTPWIARRCGLIAGYRGLTRYCAFVFAKDEVQLIWYWDEEIILARTQFQWQQDRQYQMAISIFGNQITGSVDGVELIKFDLEDGTRIAGAVGYFIEYGRITTEGITVTPISKSAVKEDFP